MNKTEVKPGPDKVKVIIEEVIQRVYLLSPDHPDTADIVQGLQQVVLGHLVENPFDLKNPPASLDHRAKKGAVVPSIMGKYRMDSEWRRMVAVTAVLPDENGYPAVEIKTTTSTITQKSVTK